MRAAALLLLAISAAAAEPAAIPQTPAGHYVKQFLAAFDRGELANDPAWNHWYALYGALRFQSVATSEPYDLRVWTKSEITDTWLSVRVIVHPEPPYAIQDIRIGTGLRPIALPSPAPLKLDETLTAVDAYFRRLAAADDFSGAVLVAKDGVTLYEKAFGFASRRWRVPNDLDTKFNIGSLTKIITAVAIGQLSDSGKLSFADPLKKYLPQYPSRATIDQLLTHTAGLGRSRFSQEAFTDRFGRSIAEQVPLTIAKPDFAPGTSVAYGNESYLLLGAIIEKASGENY